MNRPHLKKPTTPEKARKFVVNIHDALAEVPGKVRPEGEWYVMSDVEMMSHVGTHIETPFHCLKEGIDLAGLPIEQVCGETVLLDMHACQAERGVTLDQVQAAAEKAGGVRQGDMVFCRMGPKAARYFTTESLQWLVDQGMKLIGVDSGGVELPDPNHDNVNHLVLFRNNIPLIENLTHLEALSQSRFTAYALPVPVKGLDAIPLRVVAVVV